MTDSPGSRQLTAAALVFVMSSTMTNGSKSNINIEIMAIIIALLTVAYVVN